MRLVAACCAWDTPYWVRVCAYQMLSLEFWAEVRQSEVSVCEKTFPGTISSGRGLFARRRINKGHVCLRLSCMPHMAVCGACLRPPTHVSSASLHPHPMSPYVSVCLAGQIMYDVWLTKDVVEVNSWEKVPEWARPYAFQANGKRYFYPKKKKIRSLGFFVQHTPKDSDVNESNVDDSAGANVTMRILIDEMHLEDMGYLLLEITCTAESGIERGGEYRANYYNGRRSGDKYPFRSDLSPIMTCPPLGSPVRQHQSQSSIPSLTPAAHAPPPEVKVFLLVRV